MGVYTQAVLGDNEGIRPTPLHEHSNYVQDELSITGTEDILPSTGSSLMLTLQRSA